MLGRHGAPGPDAQPHPAETGATDIAVGLRAIYRRSGPQRHGSPIHSVARADWRIASWLDSSRDRKSTRLNSSHLRISYAVFCLKKKEILYQTRSHSRVESGYLDAVHRFPHSETGGAPRPPLRAHYQQDSSFRSDFFFLSDRRPPKFSPFPTPDVFRS